MVKATGVVWKTLNECSVKTFGIDFEFVGKNVEIK